MPPTTKAQLRAQLAAAQPDQDRILILEVAVATKPQIVKTHRHDGWRYSWRAYRLTGAVGGMVVCVAQTPGQNPHVHWVGYLDRLAEECRGPHLAWRVETGAEAASTTFLLERRRLLDR